VEIMGNYFYGRITKSGKKLLVNVPIKKTEFEYNRLVKVFLLPKDIDLEAMEVELENSEALNGFMNLNDAGQIIRDLDKQYDFKGKSGDEIREYAKKLRGSK
jgi:hypothetical protein